MGKKGLRIKAKRRKQKQARKDNLELILNGTAKCNKKRKPQWGFADR